MVSAVRSVADAGDAARKALSRMLRRGLSQRRSATRDRHASTPENRLAWISSPDRVALSVASLRSAHLPCAAVSATVTQ